MTQAQRFDYAGDLLFQLLRARITGQAQLSRVRQRTLHRQLPVDDVILGHIADGVTIHVVGII